jgi:hypothetical protein
MFNLEENLIFTLLYNNQIDLVLQIFLYSTSVVIVVDFLREQVPEINLLQLIPGFYIFLLFFSYLFLLFFSQFFLKLSLSLEVEKRIGTKILDKLNLAILLNFSFFLFFFILVLNFHTLIPISLEIFNTYGEKTLENVWSFNEVMSLEGFFLIILTLFSQIPTIIHSSFFTEKQTNYLPNFWKPILLIIFLFSGVFTPTVDGYSQLSLSFSSLFLYLLALFYLKKRLNIKLNGFSFYGF